MPRGWPIGLVRGTNHDHPNKCFSVLSRPSATLSFPIPTLLPAANIAKAETAGLSSSSWHPDMGWILLGTLTAPRRPHKLPVPCPGVRSRRDGQSALFVIVYRSHGLPTYVTAAVLRCCGGERLEHLRARVGPCHYYILQTIRGQRVVGQGQLVSP